MGAKGSAREAAVSGGNRVFRLPEEGSGADTVRALRVAVLDLRGEETIYVGNRFLIYALYPETNISIHVLWGRQRRNTVFAVGKSIFDRSAHINIGRLMLDRGGGGHSAAGTCQVANDQAESVLDLLIAAIETGRVPRTPGSERALSRIVWK